MKWTFLLDLSEVEEVVDVGRRRLSRGLYRRLVNLPSRGRDLMTSAPSFLFG